MTAGITPLLHQVILLNHTIKPVPVLATAALMVNPQVTLTHAKVTALTHTTFILHLRVMAILKMKQGVAMDMVQMDTQVQEGVQCLHLVVLQDVCLLTVTLLKELHDQTVIISSDCQCSMCPCTN